MALKARIDSPQALGRVLEQARLLNGMTQRDVARALDTDQKYVWELEAGKATVAIQRLLRAANLLGVRLVAEVDEPDSRSGRA